MQWRRPIPLSALLVLVLVTSTHAQAPETMPRAQTGGTLPLEALHLVQKNDNLHLLAAYYYGDARQWSRIFETNRSAIQHPSVIHPGQILRLVLTPDWTPAEPYQQWKNRVAGMVAAAVKAAPEAPERPAAPPRAGTVVIGPSMIQEQPPAPPAETETPEPPAPSAESETQEAPAPAEKEGEK